VSHGAVATFLQCLREQRAEHTAGAEVEWTRASWQGHLATAAEVPSVRRVALPPMAWDAAGLASLRRLFPQAHSFHLKQIASPAIQRATLAVLLSTFWDSPLRALRADGFGGAAGLPEGVPGFAATLEALHLRDAPPGLVERLIARMGSRSTLRAVTLAVDARHDPCVTLTGDTLEAVTLYVRKRPAGAALTFAGRLSALRDFSLTAQRDDLTELDVRSLGALLVGARATLTRVALRAPHAWRHAAALAEALAATPGPALPTIEVERLPLGAPEAPEARAEDFAHLQRVRARGFAVDPAACLAVVDRGEHLRALVDPLSTLDALHLVGEVHAFLLRDPSQLTVFRAARSLDVLDAGALTRDGLLALLQTLPALTSLRLTNNHNPQMDLLSLRSASLESACFTHFHALRGFDLDAPSLRALTLDNCDADTLDPIDDARGVDGATVTIYGAFAERFLAALLDGEAVVRLPALRVLSLWNNPIGMGSLGAIEARRVAVACRAGHPSLRTLHLQNVAHLRSLTLRDLPALTTLSVSQCDDAGPGTTWLEAVDLAGLPAGCDVTLCALSPGRVGR
jgi:hypothetical protein